MSDGAVSQTRRGEAAPAQVPSFDDIVAAFACLGLCVDHIAPADAHTRLIGIFINADAFIDEQLRQHGWQAELDQLEVLHGVSEYLHFDRLAFERRLRQAYHLVNFERWVFVFQR